MNDAPGDSQFEYLRMCASIEIGKLDETLPPNHRVHGQNWKECHKMAENIGKSSLASLLT
jgi:hypothetical protein